MVRDSLVEVKSTLMLKESTSRPCLRKLKLPTFVTEALQTHWTAMQKEGHGSEFYFVTKSDKNIGKNNLTI